VTAVALWAHTNDGLAGLPLGGALTTMALVCLSIGLESTAMPGVALICAVTTRAGGLVYGGFMERAP